MPRDLLMLSSPQKIYSAKSTVLLFERWRSNIEIRKMSHPVNILIRFLNNSLILFANYDLIKFVGETSVAEESQSEMKLTVLLLNKFS